MITRCALLGALALLLAACASSVSKKEGLAYSYEGQKFGRVVVRLSDELAADPQKVAAFSDMRLQYNLERRLRRERLLDEQATNVVDVVIQGFRLRSGINATLFGVFAGSDSLDGVVQLKSVEGKVLNEFSISATYALGGREGGRDYMRIGYLGGRFEELTINTILGKQ